jgi:hypothetical protein
MRVDFNLKTARHDTNLNTVQSLSRAMFRIDGSKRKRP